MSEWSPSDYLRFGDERTRPAADLAARVAVQSPSAVMDLGCGPGNSTRVLHERWPEATVTGLDDSAQMIETARSLHPELHWVVQRIEDWEPSTHVDVLFSNAALQWLPDHGPLVERLFAYVAPAGALAFQIPSANYATVRRLIHEIALDGEWSSRMTAPLNALTMEQPALYYEHLAPLAQRLDMWETEYVHVLESPSAIVDWISSTGLRPFVDVLESDDERQLFLDRLTQRVCESYPTQSDGRVLFPFRRLFIIAYS